MMNLILFIFMFISGDLSLIKAEISSALIQRQFINAQLVDNEPLSVLSVPSLLHCAMSCSGTPDCLAFNFMKTSQPRSCYLHDNVANDNNLVPNENYDYYEVNECYDNNPCWNDGICFKPINSTQGVTCQCPNEYTGNLCQDVKTAELQETTTVDNDFREVDPETVSTTTTSSTTITTPTTPTTIPTTMTTSSTTIATPTTPTTIPTTVTTTTKTTPTTAMTTSATTMTTPTTFSFQWPTNAQSGAQQSTNCSGTINLSDNSKTFTSDNYPKYYENNLNCTWLIQTTTEGTLSITVNNLDVETSISCFSDRLSVFNGPTILSEQTAKLCGNITNYAVPQTTSNTAVIQFITDGNFNFIYSGFNLSYRLIPDAG